MRNTESKPCPVCRDNAKITRKPANSSDFVECPTCGRYLISDTYCNERPKDMSKLASYLYYNGFVSQPIETKPGHFYNFIGSKEAFEKEYQENPYCYHVTDDIVENWYPKTFSEKIDMFLLGLSKRSKFYGDSINFNGERLYSALFCTHDAGDILGDISFDTYDEKDITLKFFIEYLQNHDFVKYYCYQNLSSSSEGSLVPDDYLIIIRHNGWQRIDELQKNIVSNTKKAFVAMSYADEMKPVEEAIQQAIIKCGYEPVIMKNIEYNHQIVPEMLYQIKQSKFVIAEFTNHNNGAYYEAGYAAALGKEVIHLCKKSSFENVAHFDIAQENIVQWINEQDLIEKLTRRIEATIK